MAAARGAAVRRTRPPAVACRSDVASAFKASLRIDVTGHQHDQVQAKASRPCQRHAVPGVEQEAELLFLASYPADAAGTTAFAAWTCRVMRMEPPPGAR